MSARLAPAAWIRILWGAGSPVLDGAAGRVVDLDDAHLDELVDELYRPPAGPWIRMNMLGTLNARVTGPDGTSDSITNRADRVVLGRIRAMSDAIVVGARTLREERHTPTGDTPLVVVTRSGELAGHRIGEDDARAGVIVLCPASAAEAVARTMPGARVEHPVGGDDVPVDEVVAWCRAAGFESLVVEGGGRLIGQFLDAGLLDEACLTQAPVFGPADAPQLPASTAGTRFDRALVALDDRGFAYTRLVAADRADRLAGQPAEA